MKKIHAICELNKKKNQQQQQKTVHVFLFQ